MSKALLLFFTTIIALSATTVSSYACRCANPSSTGQAYNKVDLVIKGTVKKLTGNAATAAGTVAMVTVSDAWKGKAAPSVIKVVNQRSCAFEFSAGQSYVLFLHKIPGQKIYTTYKCSGNKVISKARKTINWLESHAKPTPVSH